MLLQLVEYGGPRSQQCGYAKTASFRWPFSGAGVDFVNILGAKGWFTDVEPALGVSA
jgi:hypothetical protein